MRAHLGGPGLPDAWRTVGRNASTAVLWADGFDSKHCCR